MEHTTPVYVHTDSDNVRLCAQLQHSLSLFLPMTILVQYRLQSILYCHVINNVLQAFWPHILSSECNMYFYVWKTGKKGGYSVRRNVVSGWRVLDVGISPSFRLSLGPLSTAVLLTESISRYRSYLLGEKFGGFHSGVRRGRELFGLEIQVSKANFI